MEITDRARYQGNRWVSFGLVLAIVMMLTASVTATAVSLMAYSRSYSVADVDSKQSAAIHILEKMVEANRWHIDRLYREIEQLREQLRQPQSRR